MQRERVSCFFTLALHAPILCSATREHENGCLPLRWGRWRYGVDVLTHDRLYDRGARQAALALQQCADTLAHSQGEPILCFTT